MKKNELIIIIAILMISLVFLYFFNIDSDKEAKKIIEIQVGSQIYRRVAIKSNDYEETIPIKSNLGLNVLKIYNGGVEMIEADCKNKVGINTGFISKAGEMIVCLPHEVLVQIKGVDEKEGEKSID
jgi:hypothetical protein